MIPVSRLNIFLYNLWTDMTWLSYKLYCLWVSDTPWLRFKMCKPDLNIFLCSDVCAVFVLGDDIHVYPKMIYSVGWRWWLTQFRLVVCWKTWIWSRDTVLISCWFFEVMEWWRGLKQSFKLERRNGLPCFTFPYVPSYSVLLLLTSYIIVNSLVLVDLFRFHICSPRRLPGCQQLSLD